MTFDLSDRDYATVLLADIDLDAQLAAVREMLSRNRRAGETLSSEIEEIAAHAKAASGAFGLQLENDWVDHLHHSVYQDAANSMAAVGMLAPLIEAVFTRLFQALGQRAAEGGEALGQHMRGQRALDDYWNPRFVFRGNGRGQDLVAGVAQLADATGLAPFLPPGYEGTLKALFGYRNKMFHHGFEWPEAERAAFAERIVKEGWPPAWFQSSRSGGEPWIFYMSDVLIRHAFDTIEAVLEGVGAFVRPDPPAAATRNST